MVQDFTQDDVVEKIRKGKIPGKIIKEVTIPAREYLAVELKKGQLIRFIDIDGQQVFDVIFFNLNNLEERTSCWGTKGIYRRWAGLRGDTLYSQLANEMCVIIDDHMGTCLDGGFCTEEINYARFGIRGMRNCRDNLTMAVAPYGLTKKDIQEDGNIGFGINLKPAPDGTYTSYLVPKQPGRYTDVLAKIDLLVAISNCPSYLTAATGYNPTPVKIVVYERY